MDCSDISGWRADLNYKKLPNCQDKIIPKDITNCNNGFLLKDINNYFLKARGMWKVCS
jgi:hypothetical protein